MRLLVAWKRSRLLLLHAFSVRVSEVDGDVQPTAAGEVALSWDFHKLFKDHAKDMTRYLQRRGASMDQAADFTQDAFARLIAAPPAATVDNPSAYLFRTARNLAINHDRRERILPFVQDQEAALLAVSDDAPSPERAVIARQEVSILQTVFAELTPIQRQILTLSRIEGRTFADIGRTLGIPPNTAFGHMTRILVRLKLRLDQGPA